MGHVQKTLGCRKLLQAAGRVRGKRGARGRTVWGSLVAGAENWYSSCSFPALYSNDLSADPNVLGRGGAWGVVGC